MCYLNFFKHPNFYKINFIAFFIYFLVMLKFLKVLLYILGTKFTF